MTALLSAPDSARWIGRCCWLEQQVFALLGRWVTEISDPGSKLVVLELSEHAAWRAQRWYELLPTAAPGADALVIGGDELEELIISADDASGAERTFGKLIVAEALMGILDRLVTGLADHTTVISGASVLRIAGIVRADIASDLDRCRTTMVGSGAPAEGEPQQGLDRFRNQLDAVSTMEFLARS
jgi:hypothetical protein